MYLTKGISAGKRLFGLGAITVVMILGAASAGTAMTLDEVIAGDHRTAGEKARDQYRHPKETLEFFGLKKDMTVVELTPGAGGWYQKILAPYLRDEGVYYGASYNPESTRDYYKRAIAKEKERLDSRPDLYGKVRMTVLEPPAHLNVAPAGSADMVLTFRNYHNWAMGGQEKAVLAAAFKALKPGGIFGITDHRRAQPAERSGYIDPEAVKAVAKAVGFEFVASSEINANPKDVGDHEKGVWTLPPTLSGDPAHHEAMKKIGESDRFTLKFRKPVN
ncbi:class I SAM-dependent methyltransferase [Emcibacter nanhaiensis]|uniref:Class I SAM-dependent methyltransferase n=1 Tax=Emcibacter nanhaiensis TaxID=1505037 RepID=A0A501PMX6_9PROT|nr:class I SAM-dependent methyltransferase [Emcibacter nanhaiensis]TPD61518.1 class I SAM-dependent methyltransferase [Emcibacter nanhaiensis]